MTNMWHLDKHEHTLSNDTLHYPKLVFAATIPGPVIMPVCSSEPRLLTSSMYTTNVMFGVVWSYERTERLPLNGVVLSYTFSTGNRDQVDIRTGSQHFQINQTLSFVTTNVHSGTFVVNVTVNSPQGSHTATCPTLYLGKYEMTTFSIRVIDSVKGSPRRIGSIIILLQITLVIILFP